MVAEARSRPLFERSDSGGRLLGASRRILGLSLLALFLVMVLTAAMTHVVPMAGYETFTIRGRSMEPALPLGAIAAVVPVERPEVGDIVTYRATNGVIVTHRVTGIVAVDGVDHLLTKGDANDDPDPNPVNLAAVVGQVEFYMPALGYLAWMLSIPSGVVAVATAFAALLLLLWLVEETEGLRRERARLRLGRL